MKGHTDLALVTSTINPCALWHGRLAHIHYKALPIVSKVVTSLPEIQIEHEGVCKGCAQGKNNKNPYLRYYPFRYMRENVNNFIKLVCLLSFLYC